MTDQPAPAADQYSVLIVDDHPIVREGLELLISQQPDLGVCGHAEDVPQPLKAFKELTPDVVVVDISLKQGNGLDLIRQLRRSNPEARMLVSSMHDETLYAERSLHAGAMGYINKQEAGRKIVEAIRQVLAGRVFLSEAMSELLMQRMVGGGAAPHAGVEVLSNRELEVFGLIGSGLTTNEIADRLSLSVKTIETYRQRIKVKLTLKSSAELARQASHWVLEQG